jgi:hypothetical protein
LFFQLPNTRLANITASICQSLLRLDNNDFN